MFKSFGLLTVESTANSLFLPSPFQGQPKMKQENSNFILWAAMKQTAPQDVRLTSFYMVGQT